MVYPIEASSRSSFRYCVDVSPDSSLRHHETRKNTAGKAYDLRIGTALAKSAGYQPSNVSSTAGDRDGFPPRTHAMNSAMEELSSRVLQALTCVPQSRRGYGSDGNKGPRPPPDRRKPLIRSRPELSPSSARLRLRLR